MMELEKAQQICRAVAMEAKRWGKHAGFASYHEDDVRQALVTCHESGLFELTGEKEARVLANRQKGAAEARAKRSLDEVEQLRKVVKEQKQLIDLQAKRIAKLEA
jgi:hypothetical protein